MHSLVRSLYDVLHFEQTLEPNVRAVTIVIELAFQSRSGEGSPPFAAAAAGAAFTQSFHSLVQPPSSAWHPVPSTWQSNSHSGVTSASSSDLGDGVVTGVVSGLETASISLSTLGDPGATSSRSGVSSAGASWTALTLGIT
eukprot:31011-Pelagococcus_subviridis.AAC.6